MMQHCSTE